MKIADLRQIKNIDKNAITEYCIPSLLLMGYAGKHCSDRIISEIPDIKSKTIAVICGSGNNGGDGFVIGFHLRNFGCHVKVLFNAEKLSKLSEESLIYYKICKSYNITSELSLYNYDDDIIIDSLLGSGFSGSIREAEQLIIKNINNSNAVIFSVDIPSGLCADGNVDTANIVNADYTLTIGIHKINTATYPGRKFCGKTFVIDAGFPEKLLNDEKINNSFFDKFLSKSVFVKKDNVDSCKSNFGHLLIIGGFDGMEGAGLMTAMSAFESRAGLVTLATSIEARKIIAGKIPEVITIGLNDPNDIVAIIKSGKYHSLLIGPGLGRTPFAAQIFHETINNSGNSSVKTVIIDGDGLWHLSIMNNSAAFSKNVIITPHLKEASLLLNDTIENVSCNRYYCAKKLSEKYRAVTVLKGPATITTDGKNTYVNSSGNEALASAGTGDILAGIIAALSMQTDNVLLAAATGVYIHGICADVIVEETGVKSLKATELSGKIRTVKAEIINT